MTQEQRDARSLLATVAGAILFFPAFNLLLTAFKFIAYVFLG